MIQEKKRSILSFFSGKNKVKKIIAAACTAAVALSAIPMLSVSVSAQTIINAKTTDYLNLRSGAGINYSVLKIIPKNTTLTVIDKSNDQWIKVKLSDGTTGYCSASYLNITTDGQTTDYLNIRRTPSIGGTVIKTLSPKTKLDIVSFSGEKWAKVIASDGTTGYVCTDYVDYISNSSAAVKSSQSSGSASAKTSNNSSASSSVKLSLSTKNLAVGNNFNLTATGNKGTIVWSTNNGKVATVNSSGNVKGVSAGDVTIRATDSKTGSSAVCKVKVVKTDYNTIKISENRKTVLEGNTFTLKATTNPAGGKVYFRSDDTSVATVDSKGKVTAKGAGTIWVTAHDSTGVVTSSCRLTVNSVSKISLSQSSITVYSGYSSRLYATVQPSNLKVMWTSSNLSVAGVNNGLVSGLMPGTAVITAKDSTGKVRAKCNVTVLSSSSGNVSLSRYSATTTAGKTIYIKGYNGYRWETSDSDIATVWDGFIETKKAGNVAISCVDSYGNRAVCSVKVTDAAPVKFAYSSPNSATINSDVELIAITDKTRTKVYFTVNINGSVLKLNATKKIADGNTYVWKAVYRTTKAGDFTVKAYSYKNGLWETCADGKTDVYVTSKTNSTATGLSRLRASDEVVKYIGLKEGFVSGVTYDTLANNIPTLGHGYVVWEGQCFYDNLTRNEAYALLVKAVNEEVYSTRVNDMLIGNNIRFNQQQFDALVSFSYNLGTGWTYSSDLKDILLNSYGYVSSDTSMTGRVTSKDGLNLRSSASISSSVIDVLSYNESVTIVNAQKYNNVWYKVRTSSGKTGYCSSTYLNVSASSSSTIGRDLNYVNRNALINELLAYHHAGGVCYYGLLYRRADELEMFLYNDYTADGRDNNHNFPNPYCISFP